VEKLIELAGSNCGLCKGVDGVLHSRSIGLLQLRSYGDVAGRGTVIEYHFRDTQIDCRRLFDLSSTLCDREYTYPMLNVAKLTRVVLDTEKRRKIAQDFS